jgi:hypothetical protein
MPSLLHERSFLAQLKFGSAVPGPYTSPTVKFSRWVLERPEAYKPGMATLVFIHSMIGIKRGKFLALTHFKTRKRVLK